MKTFQIAFALTLLASPFCLAFQYETFLADQCYKSMGSPVTVNPPDNGWNSITLDHGSKSLRVYTTDGDPATE
jgi:hypothetical protein